MESKYSTSDCLSDLVVVKTNSVRSPRSGGWGGALPKTVRSLPAIVENKKKVTIPSAHVQHEYNEDFL